MTDVHGDAASTVPNGLWRWLVGGLVGGGIILGLLIAAYAVGYHRGQHQERAAASVTVPTAATTTAPAATPPTTTARAATPPTTTAPGPVPATPALIARGKTLFSADGCAACHSLTGAPGAGPSLKGVAGETVTLSNGQTLTADDAYLEQSIADPNAKIVKGYAAGIMPAAIASFDLSGKPEDMRALVAFIKAQK